MTVRIGEIVLDCSDPVASAEFWCAALGYRRTAGDDTGVAIAGAPEAPTMLLLRTEDAKTTKTPVHLDVCPVEGTTQDEEVTRLEGLGARRVDIGQGRRSWVVMADPSGIEFCVMRSVLPPEPQPFHDV